MMSMHVLFSSRWRRAVGIGGMALSSLCAAQADGDPNGEPAAAVLKARYAALQSVLNQNQFQRPIHLVSTQGANDLKGEVHAVVSQPYAGVAAALQAREHWCDILILHLNVKQCQATGSNGLRVHIGKKFDQPLADAYQVNFIFRAPHRSDSHFQVQLDAAEGPLGTRDYKILFEAVPLDEGRTFVRMAYAYGYGLAAKVAMQAYLSTVGSDKVGFSIVDRRADGQPVHVRSVRGVVERNTMRYYLAIEAYLGSLSAPPAQQLDKRLHDWFAATERYPRQLHEVDEAAYLEIKQKETRRQHQAPAPQAM